MNKTLMSAALAIFIFAGGVFVGNMTAGSNNLDDVVSDTAGAVSDTVGTVADTVGGDDEVTDSSASSASSAGSEVIFTIDVSSLGATEKAFLASAGISGDSINVTAAMFTCAEEKLGTDRITEIQNGATPSAIEGVSLVGCY
jgi:hypothetical protein